MDQLSPPRVERLIAIEAVLVEVARCHDSGHC